MKLKNAARVIFLIFVTACNTQTFDESISGNASAMGLYTLMRVTYPINPSLDLRHGLNQLNFNSTYQLGRTFRNSQNAREYFTVSNKGAYPLQIDSISLDAGSNNFHLIDLPDFPLKLNSGNSVKFSLSLTPQTAGVKKGEILISSDDEKHPRYKAPFTLKSVNDSRLNVMNDIFSLPNNSAPQSGHGRQEHSRPVLHPEPFKPRFRKSDDK